MSTTAEAVQPDPNLLTEAIPLSQIGIESVRQEHATRPESTAAVLSNLKTLYHQEAGSLMEESVNDPVRRGYIDDSGQLKDKYDSDRFRLDQSTAMEAIINRLLQRNTLRVVDLPIIRTRIADQNQRKEKLLSALPATLSQIDFIYGVSIRRAELSREGAYGRAKALDEQAEAIELEIEATKIQKEAAIAREEAEGLEDFSRKIEKKRAWIESQKGDEAAAEYVELARQHYRRLLQEQPVNSAALEAIKTEAIKNLLKDVEEETDKRVTPLRDQALAIRKAADIKMNGSHDDPAGEVMGDVDKAEAARKVSRDTAELPIKLIEKEVAVLTRILEAAANSRTALGAQPVRTTIVNARSSGRARRRHRRKAEIENLETDRNDDETAELTLGAMRRSLRSLDRQIAGNSPTRLQKAVRYSGFAMVLTIGGTLGVIEAPLLISEFSQTEETPQLSSEEIALKSTELPSWPNFPVSVAAYHDEITRIIQDPSVAYVDEQGNAHNYLLGDGSDENRGYAFLIYNLIMISSKGNPTPDAGGVIAMKAEIATPILDELGVSSYEDEADLAEITIRANALFANKAIYELLRDPAKAAEYASNRYKFFIEFLDKWDSEGYKKYEDIFANVCIDWESDSTESDYLTRLWDMDGWSTDFISAEELVRANGILQPSEEPN